MDNLSVERELALFESKHKLIMPDDLKDYFRTFNVDDYDKDMFAFYGLDRFKSVKDEVGNWGAGPDYRDIINTLPMHGKCFVFIDYFCHLCVYAIRLHENTSEKNEVYVICGDEFKVVANSFGEFLQIYFKEEWDGIFI
jgi:hypothetical protein